MVKIDVSEKGLPFHHVFFLERVIGGSVHALAFHSVVEHRSKLLIIMLLIFSSNLPR